MSALDIVAIGEAMVEFNQTQSGEPLYLQGFGGDTSNAIIAAARAGARCAYLSRVGKDWCGERLLQLWAAESVDSCAVEQSDSAATGLYFVTHGPQGHTFDYQRTGSAASRMTPQWLPRAHIARARYLHVSGISLALSLSARNTVLEAMQFARQHGVQVSLDSNFRAKLWPADVARSVLTQAIGMCDLYLPGLDDMEAVFGLRAPEAIIQHGHALGARQVVLKLGPGGCMVSHGGQSELIAPHKVPCVDATGAGDCFAGNLLARLCAGDTLVQAAHHANVAAALSVQGFGAVAPLPTAAQVAAAMA